MNVSLPEQLTLLGRLLVGRLADELLRLGLELLGLLRDLASLADLRGQFVGRLVVGALLFTDELRVPVVIMFCILTPLQIVLDPIIRAILKRVLTDSRSKGSFIPFDLPNEVRTELVKNREEVSKHQEFFSASIVAPIVEEWSKMMAVKYNCLGYFQLLFNSVEFSQYVIMMLKERVKISDAILIRTIAVGLHLSLGAIHKWVPNKKLAYSVAVLLHAIWNTYAVYKPKVFEDLIRKVFPNYMKQPEQPEQKEIPIRPRRYRMQEPEERKEKIA